MVPSMRSSAKDSQLNLMKLFNQASEMGAYAIASSSTGSVPGSVHNGVIAMSRMTDTKTAPNISIGKNRNTLHESRPQIPKPCAKASMLSVIKLVPTTEAASEDTSAMRRSQRPFTPAWVPDNSHRSGMHGQQHHTHGIMTRHRRSLSMASGL